MKAKKINMPQEIADKIGVNLDVINEKLQALVDKKKDLPIEEVIKNTDPVKDYENFTREECLALFIDASSEAGFYQFKLDMLMKAGAIDMERFHEVMGRSISDDEGEIGDMLGFPKDFL
jgi:hypothetical protein